MEVDEVFTKIKDSIIKEKKVNFEIATKYFLDLNNVETKVKEMNEFILNYKLNYELNKNIEYKLTVDEKGNVLNKLRELNKIKNV
jgi:hypothetical protein